MKRRPPAAPSRAAIDAHMAMLDGMARPMPEPDELRKAHDHEWLFTAIGPICIDCFHVATEVERACLETIARDEGMRG